MNRILFTTCLAVLALQASAAEYQDMETIMRVASQQARCLDAVLESFNSKEEEKLAYSKFYGALVRQHRSLVAYMANQPASGIVDIIDYLRSEEILVGMLLQGTIVTAAEFNDQYDGERAGKSLSEFQRYLWNVNGCDAIYSDT